MRQRLDILLVKGGHVQSRSKAKELIQSGRVRVDGKKADKPGACYEEDTAEILIEEGGLKYVSRGGLKLEKALEGWAIDLKGMVCMDVGASTGGFTDCMLQNGAVKVYALDVGRGQLAEKLMEDARVVSMEGRNFRYTTREHVGEELDFLGADVSFISLKMLFSPARELLKGGGQLVCLIKPQFEAGKGWVGKNGVVRDPKVHRRVIGEIMDSAESAGFRVLHLDHSPIRGQEGNVEYLLHLEKRDETGEEALETSGHGESAKETLEQAAWTGGSPFAQQSREKLVRETVERGLRESCLHL